MNIMWKVKGNSHRLIYFKYFYIVFKLGMSTLGGNAFIGIKYCKVTESDCKDSKFGSKVQEITSKYSLQM